VSRGRGTPGTRLKTQGTRHKYQVIKVWRIVNLVALCLDTCNLSLPYVLRFANNTGACPSKGLSILPILFASIPAGAHHGAVAEALADPVHGLVQVHGLLRVGEGVHLVPAAHQVAEAHADQADPLPAIVQRAEQVVYRGSMMWSQAV
jgi:hypothetical protein